MLERDERSEGIDVCSDCLQEVDLEAEGTWVGAEGLVLCWACALRRGGVHDADEDRWIVPPSVEDLPDERRAHA